MVISKKIEMDEKESVRKREKFISEGGHVSSDKKKKADFTNVLVRLPTSLVEKIDERRWSSRTSWIIQAIDAQLRGWNN